MANLNKLAGLMREKRITQVDLAKALNLSPTSVSYKMTGRTLFTVNEAIRAAQFLGMTKDEYLDVFFFATQLNNKQHTVKSLKLTKCTNVTQL